MGNIHRRLRFSPSRRNVYFFTGNKDDENERLFDGIYRNLRSEYYGGAETNWYNNHQLKTIESRVESPLSSGNSSWLIATLKDYNEFGYPKHIQDFNQVDTDLTYDLLGRLIQRSTIVTSSLGQATPMNWSYQFDSGGMLSEVTSPNGLIVLYSYNNYRQISEISFKENSNTFSQTVRKYTYDGLRRLTRSEDLQIKDQQSQIRTTNYQYNFSSSGNYYENGQTITVSSPVPHAGSRSHTYDAHQRIGETMDENQQKIIYEYHPQRLWLTKINLYRDLGTTSPFAVEYTYYDSGHLKTAKDGNNIITNYEWDDFDQQIKITSPDRASAGIFYEYDQSGNVTKHKRGDGVIISMQYDTLNRLVKVDYPDPALTGVLKQLLADNNIELFYDETNANYGKGRLTSVKVNMLRSGSTNGYMSLITRYVYDQVGRIVEEQMYDGDSPTTLMFKTGYQFNVAGQLTRIEYPLSSFYKLNYSYDALGQLKNVSQDMTPNPPLYHLKATYTGPYQLLEKIIHDLSLTPDPTQNSSFATYTTGLYQGQIFTALHPTASSSTFTASGNNLSSSLQGHAGLMYRFYEYNNNGLLKGFACSSTVSNADHCYPGNKAQSFQYNGLYQLKEAGESVNGVPRFGYAYDYNGNLTQIADRATNGKVWELTYYTGTNRLQSRYIQNNQATTTENYIYDASGRRTEDHYWEYTYHSDGRLALMSPKSTNPNGKYLLFLYDHLGRRYMKMTFTTLDSSLPNFAITQTYYFYDQFGNLLEEGTFSYPATTSSIRTWVWNGNTLLFTNHEETDNNNVHSFSRLYSHLDHIGRVGVATDIYGVPMWRSVARPFGSDKGMSLQNKSWQEGGAWEEITLTIPIEAFGSSAQLHRELLKPGVYAVQFYFHQLNLTTTGRDLLFVSQQDGSGSYYTIYGYTGNYTTSGGSGFWSNVIPVSISDIKTAPATPNGTLQFDFLPYGSDSSIGFKISKVRLWYVASGKYGDAVKGGSQDRHPVDVNNKYLPGPNWTASKIWTSPTYSYPGSSLIRVCFDNFDVEYHYDYVKILDGNNQVMEVLTGYYGNTCSAWIAGDKLTVELYADNSVQYSGFTISRIEMKAPIQVRSRFPGQWHDKDTEVSDTNGNILSFGLHYNWHRYYDPNVGRYLTTDPLGLEAGTNPYQYALSNPFYWIDLDGLAPSDYSWLSNFSRWIHWHEKTYIKPIANASAGFGDYISSGFGVTKFLGLPSITQVIRNHMGTNNYVNSCSLSYNVGEIFGYAWTAAFVGSLYRIPPYLYHHTSEAYAAKILADGAVIPSSIGVGGSGVYLTRFQSSFLAKLQGAKSTEAIIKINTTGLPIKPTWFPGTFIHKGKLLLK